jgi:hypothetical protein
VTADSSRRRAAGYNPAVKPWIPHLRAAFVLFHLVAVTLMAVPAPAGGMKRGAWKDPTVQAEFAAWTDRFNALGAGLTVEEFEQQLWDFAVVFMEGRTRVLSPFQPYYHWAGTWQTWRMFIAPHRYPARLNIDLLFEDGWRTVYVARSDEHTWLRQELDQERMRSAMFRYGWSSYRNTWREFVDWTALRALEDYPEATRLRARMYKQRTPTPEEARAGTEIEGKWVNTELRNLEKLREERGG